MKAICFGAAFVALTFCATPRLNAQHAAADPAADPAIDSARARFLESFVKKDTAILRERLTDDAITWFRQGGGGNANVGIAAIMTFYGGLFSGALRTEMVFTPESLARDGLVLEGRAALNPAASHGSCRANPEYIATNR